jgi:hypothetical protein
LRAARDQDGRLRRGPGRRPDGVLVRANHRQEAVDVELTRSAIGLSTTASRAGIWARCTTSECTGSRPASGTSGVEPRACAVDCRPHSQYGFV